MIFNSKLISIPSQIKANTNEDFLELEDVELRALLVAAETHRALLTLLSPEEYANLMEEYYESDTEDDIDEP